MNTIVDSFKSDRLLRGYDEIDSMTPELRQCVHEFGFEIVRTIAQEGITKPSKIRNIVMACWAGPRNHYNRAQGNSKNGGHGTSVERTLDALLINMDAKVNAATLVRILALNGLVIVPREPSEQMIQASIHALDGEGRVTHHQKHLLRLRKAIAAGIKHLWPKL